MNSYYILHVDTKYWLVEWCALVVDSQVPCAP